MSEEATATQKKRGSMRRFSFSLTDKNIAQLTELQDELGFASITETVRGAIQALHSKTFPSYTRTGREVVIGEPEVTTVKPSKQELKAQREANELALAVRICEDELNGVVAYDETGKPVKCAYFQYDGRRRYEQEIDIMSVSKELVESQYLPNKDYVAKLQRDGNIDYDLNETIEDVMSAED